MLKEAKQFYCIQMLNIMKKLILILSLIITMHAAVKAQDENQLKTYRHYTALTTVALKGDNTYLIGMYSHSNNAPAKDYDYYMHKRKNNLTAGLVTLGGGLVFSGIGLLMADINSSNDATWEIGGILLITGAVSGLVSIPFMIMAGANKHKARALLNTQKTGFGVPPGVSNSIAGITIQIPFES